MSKVKESFMTPTEALIRIRDHVKEVSTNGKRTLKVKCDSASTANVLIYIYQVLYGVENVNDAEFRFLNTNKIAYPRFRTADLRDNALAVTQALINGEEVTFTTTGGTITVDGGNVNANNTQQTVTVGAEETETDTSLFGSSTTYVIIGAAAIIVILLLWDRKKK